MSFVLSVTDGQVIYAMHNKLYPTAKLAQIALNTRIKNGSLSSDYKVYEVWNWNLRLMSI